MTDIFVSSVAAWVLLPESNFINNMENGEMGYRNGSCMALTADLVKLWALV
jgi:hypothetical protein